MRISNNKESFLALSLLILACTLSRLLPHPPNFSPIEAVALFAGVHFRDRLVAVLVPLVAMVISDFFLGFHETAFVVYACIALMALAGGLLRDRVSITHVAAAGFGSALFFFLVTNFMVWLIHGTAYCREGLMPCYAAALPFFQNQLAGVAFYSILLFCGYAMLQKLRPSLAASR